MDATSAMVKTIFWFVFIVGVLSIIATWYLVVGVVGAIIAVAVYLYRAKRAKEVVAGLAPSVGGFLADGQVRSLEKPGNLELEEGKSLRVVNTLKYRDNHEWLARHYQVERQETLRIEGTVVAGLEFVEGADEGIESEILYVTVQDRIIGHLSNVDFVTWYDQILEVGGAANCRINVTFTPYQELSAISVHSWND